MGTQSLVGYTANFEVMDKNTTKATNAASNETSTTSFQHANSKTLN